MLRKYVLKLRYLGTNFYGWQTQPGFRTVQGDLELLLSKVFKHKVKIYYPSRTDSGVHAIEQYASFTEDDKYTTQQLFKILNTQLSNDLKVIAVFIVQDDFCVQKPEKKTYLYRILTTQFNDPLKYGRVWWYPTKIDFDRLQSVKSFFLGTKDFKSFMGTGASVKTTVRTITDINIVKDNDEIRIYLTANGFLKNMVRNLVGTMIDYARGLFNDDDILSILEAKDRTKAGICAPAHGLYLYKIYYKELEDKIIK